MQSTGPASAAGKAAASQNAFKHGMRPRLRALAREVNEVLREQQVFLRRI